MTNSAMRHCPILILHEAESFCLIFTWTGKENSVQSGESRVSNDAARLQRNQTETKVKVVTHLQFLPFRNSAPKNTALLSFFLSYFVSNRDTH